MQKWEYYHVDIHYIAHQTFEWVDSDNNSQSKHVNHDWVISYSDDLYVGWDEVMDRINELGYQGFEMISFQPFSSVLTSKGADTLLTSRYTLNEPIHMIALFKRQKVEAEDT
jgi:hypothetical protein